VQRTGLILLLLAALFLGAALRDARRSDGGRSAARQTWMRVGLIFAAVGLGLQLLGYVSG
jgi:hypothetical protein